MTNEARSETQPTSDACVRCGAAIESMGVEKFRVGGTRGPIKLLIGEWGELGEEMIPLELLGCRRCRHVEFRLPLGG